MSKKGYNGTVKTYYEDLPEDLQVQIPCVYSEINVAICSLRNPEDFNEGVTEKALINALEILNELMKDKEGN